MNSGAENAELPPGDGRGRVVANILLVDDEPRNLDVLESFLRSPDFRLVRAQSADQALLHLLDGEYAAIVLDIQMPKISGLELASLIKQRKKTQHIPIIFLTAYYQEDKDVLQGYGTGAVDYLTKPINPQILKSKIDVFVDLFRKTRLLLEANAALEAQVRQRQDAEAALQIANNELEARVLARTADLKRANEELREREAALRASEAQAKAASSAKDEFLAALSHELRTPLSPVLLLATESANDANLPAAVRGDFETIAKNVSLEARLIDDLLDLTRISHGKLTLEMRPFDAHAVLRHAISITRGDSEAKGIELGANLAAARSTVVGDEVRLEQAFWNVINNAIKFTPENGRVVVSTRSVDNELEVQVTDSGIGMTPDELKRIFKAFAQGDHVLEDGSRRFGGLGLGLAISQSMIRRHEGSITASSGGRGQGTTFVIRLPLNMAVPGPEKARKLPDEPTGHDTRPADGRKRRVLLVEDHQPTSAALTTLLIRRSYDVTAAGCIADARAAAGAEKFDLLISDLGLPDGDACALMSELRGVDGLVGIALSGYGRDEDIKRTREAGFAGHLTKPVSADDLDRALGLVCPRSAA
ncbi:MAG TPA: response regulator [Opitutaceae bacterium]